MLELRKVETSYSQSQVLFGLDLQINVGEVVTLLGRNVWVKQPQSIQLWA